MAENVIFCAYFTAEDSAEQKGIDAAAAFCPGFAPVLFYDTFRNGKVRAAASKNLPAVFHLPRSEFSLPFLRLSFFTIVSRKAECKLKSPPELEDSRKIF